MRISSYSVIEKAGIPDHRSMFDGLGFLLLQEIFFCRVLDIRVTKIMKTYTRHIVFLQHIGKMGTHITRFDNLANLVYEDVIEVILVVVGAAQPTIFCLIRFHPEQYLLIWVNKRECPTAGFCLCSVTGYKCVFAIYLCFLNGVLDCNCLIIKINRIPFQANNLAAAQPIESRRNDGKFSRIFLKDLSKFSFTIGPPKRM